MFFSEQKDPMQARLLVACGWLVVLAVVLMITPDYTFTKKFWVDGFSDQMFNIHNNFSGEKARNFFRG